jgi:FkbM family methyltransferase
MGIKKIIKKSFNKLGFNISRVNKGIDNASFDELLKNKIKEKPVIFDVGGNQGQSIEKFQKIFTNPIIHSFEPIKSEFNIMFNKFNGNKNIFLNNVALGEKITEKEFHVTPNSANSSFNKINFKSEWFKNKKTYSDDKNYGITSQKVKINTIDNYCNEHNIQTIDFLKIDTQGYEDMVLKGSYNKLKNNDIKAISAEIMFDNVYEKYFSFSDIEKYLLPNNFRMVGLDLVSNNLFSNLVFFADVYYFNKKHYNV